jgi:hypothetical protein
MQLMEDRHELGEIESVLLCKALLSKSMVRIPCFPVVRRAKGDS